jgi:hypothetical protein
MILDSRPPNSTRRLRKSPLSLILEEPRLELELELRIESLRDFYPQERKRENEESRSRFTVMRKLDGSLR